MERLSSCYFCGTAVDAPVEEYSVIPRSLDPDPENQARITLCPTCRDKLGAVVERVVAAAETPDGTPDATEGPSSDAGGPPSATADAAGVDASAGGAAVDPHRGTAEPDETAETSSEPIDGASRKPPVEGGGPEGAGAGSGDEPDGAESSDAVDGNSSGVEGPDPDRATGEGTAAESTGDDAGVGAGGGTAESAGDDAGGSTAIDAAVTDDVSVLEYNKVMRLLRNREFPVDRADIASVATSAYDISPSAFDAIVDAAVDRGLVAEDDEGQLVRVD